jgi:MSHA biogenesis protein MshN
MSLINQMLQDLDARQALPGGRHPLPSAVRSLPARRSSRLPLILASLLVLVLAGGFALYQFDLLHSSGAPETFPVRPVAIAPAPSPAPPVALPVAPVEAEPPVAPEPPPEASAPPEKSARQDATLRLRAAKSMGVESRASPLKESAPAGEPTAARRKPEAGEMPPKVAERVPPTAAKSAKGTAVEKMIEKNDSSGSPRERAETDYRKAIGAVNQGRVVEAIDGLRAVLRENDLHSPARQLLVNLLLEAKRLDEAAEVLRDGLQGQPAQIAWAMTLARLQLDRANLAGAWQTLDFSLPAAGNSADYQGFAAHLLQRLGRHREAAKHYQAATVLAPGDGRWWLGLGLAQEAEGNSSEARAAFLQARQTGKLSAELLAVVEQKLR